MVLRPGTAEKWMAAGGAGERWRWGEGSPGREGREEDEEKRLARAGRKRVDAVFGEEDGNESNRDALSCFRTVYGGDIESAW